MSGKKIENINNKKLNSDMKNKHVEHPSLVIILF